MKPTLKLFAITLGVFISVAACIPLASAQSAPVNYGTIGPYFWTGSVAGVANSSIMAEGLKLAKSLGASVIRIAMSARSDEDYEGGSCIPNFTLTSLAERPDYKAILSDPQFSTVIITAYDGVTFGDCATKSYLDPNFYTAANTQKIEQEYTDFANYLKQFNKTFIISNWEGDNDAYCNDAYDATSSSCPGAASNLAGLQKWFQARYIGIHASGAGNVASAIEFNIVTSLKSKNLPSVLYDVIPNVSADDYLYSSYESINVSADQFSKDIDTIRTKISGPLIIGEVGFQVGDFGDATTTAERLQQMLAVAGSKGVSDSIIWNLLDNPPGFGLYDSSGNLTTSGVMVKDLIGNIPFGASPTSTPTGVPVIAGVQGFNPTTGAYANGTVTPGQYMILYGTFGTSGNTVAVNGTDITSDITYQGSAGAPTTAAPDQINILLPASAPWLTWGSANSVVVTTSGGITTAPVSFAAAFIRPVALKPLAPSTSTAASSFVTLQLGDQNVAVAVLQRVLAKQGYLSITVPTGYFGSLTKAAVIAYQKAENLPQTGTFLIPTSGLSAFFSAGATPFIGAAVGSTGTQVKSLQQFLIQRHLLSISAPTTYFGPLTQAAVIAFQRAKGLPQTGALDQATFAAMNGGQ